MRERKKKKKKIRVKWKKASRRLTRVTVGLLGLYAPLLISLYYNNTTRQQQQQQQHNSACYTRLLKIFIMNLNLSASLNIWKLITRPSLCLPHHTVPTFADLPIPLDGPLNADGKRADIRAVVLDKDDCFAFPEANTVYPSYEVRFLCSLPTVCPQQPIHSQTVADTHTDTPHRSILSASRLLTPAANC